MTLFAFYGTFMRGQPGHGQLARARFIQETRTAQRYRLYHVDGRWPALIASQVGVEIACELYEISEEFLAGLAAIEPSGWSRAPLELADGRVVEGFLGTEALALRGVDVSAHGDWASYVRSVAYQTTSEPCQNAVPR